MRTGLLALACAFAAGCGDSAPMGQDMATGGGDMAMMPMPDMAMMPMPDMATGPDMTTFTGTVALTEIQGQVMVMGQPVTVRTLAPSVAFSTPGFKNDYDDMALIGGCSANHFDAAKMDLPGQDYDAGEVTITGYQGGLLLNGMMAPKEIRCVLSGMNYKCGYGPVMGGMPGPSPSSTPYPQMVDPMTAGTAINIKAAGGAVLGSFDTGMDVKAANTLAVMEDLTKIKYSGTADTTINFTCPDAVMGMCPTSVAIVNLFADQNPPAMNAATPTATFGGLRCTAIAGMGKLTVKKAAIGAMLGCDMNGMNCDAAIKSVRSVVIRVAFPTTKMDSKGYSITAVAGKGVFGVSPN